MKYLLMFLPIIIFSQDLDLGDNLFDWYDGLILHSEFDFDRVENEGDTTCYHSWSINDYIENPRVGCLVMHGLTGCPDNWTTRGKICRLCLRKEIWQERYWTTEKPKSEYEILNAKIED